MKSANQVTFSVVIPLYNKEQHIERTLLSVLNQTAEDFEIIVVDDGSTDGGAELVRTAFVRSSLGRGKVKLVQQSNAGVSAARNTGIAYAKGEIVAFIDADDSWEPHFLSEIESLARQFPEAGAFGTGYQVITDGERYMDPKIRFITPCVKPRILHDYFEIGAKGALPFTMSSFAIKSELLSEIGGFPSHEPMGEDQDLFCRAALASKIAYTPSVLSFYHLDAQNRACVSNIPDEECPFSKRLVNSVNESNLDNQQRHSVLAYSAAHLLHIASLNIRSGRKRIAAALLKDARCRYHFTRYLWWKLRCLMPSFAAQ